MEQGLFRERRRSLTSTLSVYEVASGAQRSALGGMLTCRVSDWYIGCVEVAYVDWIKGFYSETGEWWGPVEAAVTDNDRRRVDTIKRICGTSRKRLLELGTGYGNTAAATAEEGYEVTGVEISERAKFSDQFLSRKYRGSLKIIREDFYAVQLDSPFDIVTYWNGFGVGRDDDNRRLLKRIAHEWLVDDGVALIDIANPFTWASWAGEEESKSAQPEIGYSANLTQRIDFDPVANRFVDTWWETEKPQQKISQSIRCYSPADLALLLEGTGLAVKELLVNGASIDKTRDHIGFGDLLQRSHEYLAVLTKDGSPKR